jgi:hypothetical protein
MSTSNIYTPGLNHVGSYQVSGAPYMSGSALDTDPTVSLRFEFPSVAKSITVKSNHANIRVHFAPYTAGQYDYTGGAVANNNFVIVANGESQTFDFKCKEIFISNTGTTTAGSNDVQVFAELTNIPAARMYSLDGVVGVTN